MINLTKEIQAVKNSIIAIGFKPTEDQITILGSGFAISNEGKILSAAHVYNQLKPEDTDKLLGMAMVKQDKNGLEEYAWLPLKLIKKNDQNDLALFQLLIPEHQNTLMKKIDLGDSENIQVGQQAYFLGFPYAAQLINEGFGITLIASQTMISNIKRDGMSPTHYKNWFIVDAISNPGNSGCPLFDIKNNKVIGVMTISFRMPSKAVNDIREPMHIAGAKPINLAKELLI